MMKRDLRFSRRNMLQAIGAGAALLPLLESDKADAACLVSGIKRMYIFCWPNGMLSSINSWATKGDDPTSWQLAPFQTNAGNLTALMPDLLLLEGVDYTAIKQMPGNGERTGHACYPVMLTGAFYQTLASTSADIAGGISVDQYVGSALKAQGYGGLVSLNLGSFVQSTGHLSWKGPARRTWCSPISTPRASSTNSSADRCRRRLPSQPLLPPRRPRPPGRP